MSVILTTLNARYIHSSLGLRYLYANMGALQEQTSIREFGIDQRAVDIAESLMANSPDIIGIGVYIWNVEAVYELVTIIKSVSPNTTIVLGGPEVGFAQDLPRVAEVADFIIAGSADVKFADLCGQILAGRKPLQKFIAAEEPKLETLQWPYSFYLDEDVRNRVIYVEASRGCPFRCEFCLSALDKTAWAFPLESFLQQMEQLYQRGVRHFKFVDRTFNLKVENSARILQFFLQHMDEELLVHFELIPDHLPERLKEIIKQFPRGSLQFEIGIQSFNPTVQQLISRKQDDYKTEENIRWLVRHSQAHLHTDLIIGLPGEDMQSFLQGFDRLIGLGVHEIQVGILKRLRGTPIVRHTDDFEMLYHPVAPYQIVSNRNLDFFQMQRLSRFARYWDMVGNSGRFTHSLKTLLAEEPAQRFLVFSDWLYEKTRQTHRIALLRLFELMYLGLQECFGVQADVLIKCLSRDFFASGLKSLPSFISRRQVQESQKRAKSAKQRQLAHLRD